MSFNSPVSRLVAQSLNLSTGTNYQTYRDFTASFNTVAPRRISDLRPIHLTRWLDSQTGWSDATKNMGGRAVKRAFSFAAKQGLIDRSPVAAVTLPPSRPREILLSQEQWQQLLDAIPDQGFRDFVITLHETGARPQEVRAVCAEHVRGDTWLFSKIDSKGQSYNRIIHLTDKAQEITNRLVGNNSTGPLFRNLRGQPWTKNAVVCRFRRLSQRLGFRVNAYALRHTWATEALERDVDPISVAILMGHRDTTMVSRVYQHLAYKGEHLRKALRRATNGGADD